MWLVYWMSLQAGEKIVGFVRGKLFFFQGGIALPLQVSFFYET